MSVDIFDSLDVLSACVWIPDCGRIFQVWSNQGFVCLPFHLSGARSQVFPWEDESSVCLRNNAVDALVELRVVVT